MEITQEHYNEIIRGEMETQTLVKSVDQKITMLIPKVEQNQHALFGHNGTPGLLAWQQSHDQQCLSCRNDIGNLKNAIFGDPTDRKDSGLKGEIKDVKEEQEEIASDRRKRDKILWAAISASVTLIVTTILQAIMSAVFAGG